MKLPIGVRRIAAQCAQCKYEPDLRFGFDGADLAMVAVEEQLHVCAIILIGQMNLVTNAVAQFQILLEACTKTPVVRNAHIQPARQFFARRGITYLAGIQKCIICAHRKAFSLKASSCALPQDLTIFAVNAEIL